MNKNKLLIGIGALNTVHASVHIIQFVQSIFLAKVAMHGHSCSDEHLVLQILHNPYLALLWAAIGILTMYIGFRDFKHHQHCNH